MSGLNAFLFLLLGFVGVLTVFVFRHDERVYEEAYERLLQEEAMDRPNRSIRSHSVRATGSKPVRNDSFLPVYAAVIGMQDPDRGICTDFMQDRTETQNGYEREEQASANCA